MTKSVDADSIQQQDEPRDDRHAGETQNRHNAHQIRAQCGAAIRDDDFGRYLGNLNSARFRGFDVLLYSVAYLRIAAYVPPHRIRQTSEKPGFVVRI